MNHYLYIDTSSAQSCIMLMNDERVLGFRVNSVTTNHASFINVHIRELLAEFSIKMKDLKVVFVLNGPGSYTGLRISLSVAKGICYAYDIPLCLINKLDLLQVCASTNSNSHTILKAREDEYFVGAYSELGSLLNPYVLFNRSEVEQLTFESNTSVFIESNLESEFPSAQVVTINFDGIFEICSKKNQALEYADLFTSEPFYLKNVYVNKINKL